MDDFREFLQQLISESEYSPGVVARLANIDQSYIYKILSGDRKPPSRDVIIRIAKALELDFQAETKLLVLAEYAPSHYEEALSYSKGERLVSDQHHGSIEELKALMDQESLGKEDYDELIEYLKNKREKHK